MELLVQRLLHILQSTANLEDFMPVMTVTEILMYMTLHQANFLFSFAGHGEKPGEFAEDIDGIAIGPYDLVFAMNTDRRFYPWYIHQKAIFVTAFGKAVYI